MMTMDGRLLELYQQSRITKETLLNTGSKYEFVSKQV